MELVNGYFCRNCADVELAKKGIDPAHPTREVAGSEVYVPPKDDDPRQNLEGGARYLKQMYDRFGYILRKDMPAIGQVIEVDPEPPAEG